MAAHVDPLKVRSRHQSLHHFVADANWSDEQMLLRVCQWVVPLMDFSDGGWWIIDDTGLPKQGRHSAGVARQYCGMLGKQDNCQVAVSVSLACEAASIPVAWQLYLPREWDDDPVRRDKAGVPEVEIEGWTTSLLAGQFSAEKIIALYADHGTHEQFHSEFKTDLDLERLPSGKFDTNYLVCQLAALAMNILRLMGQSGLLGPDAPVRHAAKRRRLKTVMQELIYRAGRIIETGRKLILGLGANDRAATAFRRLNGELFAASS